MPPAEELPIYPLRYGVKITSGVVQLRTRSLVKSSWRAKMTAKPDVGFFALIPRAS